MIIIWFLFLFVSFIFYGKKAEKNPYKRPNQYSVKKNSVYVWVWTMILLSSMEKKSKKKLLDHTKIRKGFSYPHFFLFFFVVVVFIILFMKTKNNNNNNDSLVFFFLVVFGKLGKFFVYKCDLYNRIDRSIDGNVFGCCFYATAILWRSFFSVKHHFRQTLFF